MLDILKHNQSSYLGLGEKLFMFIRYLLWSVTIIGCILGYAHTIFSYLWNKKIRNLDFTIAGWFTNAICYGPLLGFIIWQMVPPLTGSSPIITEGPLHHMVLITELFLNLIYTLSIWNLGIMFGVMTDKGVRKNGFYGTIRHPSYTLESLMFVMIFLKGLSTFPQWCAVSMFIFTYYIRSEREDKFMSESNPDYREYKKAVPFKFIPGFY
ncbi:MAG: hypothetical protein NTZ48_07065 [Candidatus Omnitrophica bacterium]|nr:hypothetical protein [Candidatus Omnitrophota bacterium]